MTSGIFHTVPLESITIERDGRQRRELLGIPELADSIRRLGLIHPPVITREHILVAGERRMTALRTLGWTEIPIQFTDEIEPAILRSIELEENIKRVDIPWQDQCRAIEEYHAIRKAEDPTWTQERTAEALGLSQPDVARKTAIAKEIAAGNERVMSAPKLSVAAGIIERTEQRKRANEHEALRSIVAPAAPKVESILNQSFLDWAPTYDGPRFNLIHCDFPYGIGAGEFNQGGGKAHGGYDDSPDTYWALLDCLVRNLDRIALPSCHLVFWYSMKYHQETINVLRSKTDFVVDDFPLIWLKSDNVGILPDPKRGPRRIYETALFAQRGDRHVVGAVANAYAAPTVRDRHMSEKPEPVLNHFFRMLVDEHTRLLDPTCGSGSALRSAESLKAENVLGLEINPEFAERARLALAQSRTLRSAK